MVLLRQAGFTLLEVMVVIALIAFVTTGVSLTIYHPQNLDSDINPKQSFAKLLRSLSQRAIQEQTWYGVVFTQDSYQVVFYSQKYWLAVSDIKEYNFENKNSFTLLLDNQIVPLSQEHFRKNGYESSFSDKGYGSDDETLSNSYSQPHILISSTGVVSDFELRFIEDQEIIVLTDPYDQD